MNRLAVAHKPNILIAPLDWGLGHATRCIPIIHLLIQNNCNVFVACNGQIKALLHNEFPQIHYVDLKGYDIQYSKNSWTLPIKIGKQIPKILSTIQYENERLKEIVKEHNIHGIISDNRYGFYHNSIPSVFITHQLRIQTPFGKIGDDFLQKINYRYINKFWQCWVPDNENQLNFAGKLSHPSSKPAIPVKYVGILSRFKPCPVRLSQHLLILLSGPEPQRTLFEKTIIRELNSYDGNVVLVRGLPNESKKLELSANVSVNNHLSSIELNQKINEAGIVVARSGYSTIMDLAVLKKKSILIATPGQTEQEYLAKHLMTKNFALCIDQKKFRLKNALELSSNFNYQFVDFSSESYLNGAVKEFIAHLG